MLRATNFSRNEFTVCKDTYRRYLFIFCHTSLLGQYHRPYAAAIMDQRRMKKKITPRTLRIRHATAFKGDARVAYTPFIFRLRCRYS